MSIPETLLTFVGAPAAIIAVITLAVLGPGQMRAPARYRPGRPWPHAPAWFVPHPAPANAPAPSIGSHPTAAELTGARRSNTEPVGGASGEW